jgi:transcriptional regulator with XRE-family HTH domain
MSAPHSEDARSLGERVALLRRRRGLSQVELGTLVGRSESWVSQVERGARRLDRLSVLRKVADALEVSVTDLRPAAAESAEQAGPRSPGYIDDIRLALSGHPAVPLLLGAARAKHRTALPALRSEVDRARELMHAGGYSELGPLLAELIPALEEGLRAAAEDDRTAYLLLLAETYQSTAAVLAKLSEPEAGWIASDRAVLLAEQLGDPLQVCAGQFRMAHSFLASGHLAQARHVSQIVVTVLAQKARSGPPPEVTSLLGAFHLVLAIVAAREGDRAEAGTHLDAAAKAAKRLGADRNDYGTEFGPTNVGLHRVAVAVELGDAGHALDLAGALDSRGLSAERRARFLIDVARAHAQRRQVGEAVSVLTEAEQLAPEMVNDHPRVREIVRDLLRLADRRPSDDLTGLGRRLGLLP